MGVFFSRPPIEPPPPCETREKNNVELRKTRECRERRESPDSIDDIREKRPFRYLTVKLDAAKRTSVRIDSADRYVVQEVGDHEQHVFHPYRIITIDTVSWLIESMASDKIILSLWTHVPKKVSDAPRGSVIYRYHVSVFKTSFQKNNEFHVTCEKLVKKSNKIIMSKVCTDFFALVSGDVVPIRSRSARAKCSSELSKEINEITLIHAREFGRAFYYD